MSPLCLIFFISDFQHNQKIIHRDLACRNILVMDRELVKISDFGLSRIFTDSEYYRTTKDKKVPLPWYACYILHFLFSINLDINNSINRGFYFLRF